MASSTPAKLVERAGKFLLEDLWEVGSSGLSGVRRPIIQTLRVLFIAVEGFLDDLCLLRASALTYASMLALVPVLGISFAFLRGLGWHGERLELLILERVTVLSPEATAAVVSYIDNTNLAGLGVLGGAALLIIFVSVMNNIEQSLNAIWGGAEQRSWPRRISNYLAMMVLGPILIASAASLSAAVRSNAAIEWLASTAGLSTAFEWSLAMAAYVAGWLLFVLLYLLVPSTRVRLLPALIGGIAAGTTWQLTQIAYINFQVGMARYNAIYGALAQLPILMVWIYVSWVIVLAGAELAVAVQNVGIYSHDRRARRAGYALRERVGLCVVSELAAAAHARSPAPTVEQIARSLDVSIRTVGEAVAALVEGGLVHFGGDTHSVCFLSLAPASIPLRRVLDLLRGDSGGSSGVEPDNTAVLRYLEALGNARGEAVGDATVADLLA